MSNLTAIDGSQTSSTRKRKRPVKLDDYVGHDTSQTRPSDPDTAVAITSETPPTHFDATIDRGFLTRGASGTTFVYRVLHPHEDPNKSAQPRGSQIDVYDHVVNNNAADSSLVSTFNNVARAVTIAAGRQFASKRYSPYVQMLDHTLYYTIDLSNAQRRLENGLGIDEKTPPWAKKYLQDCDEVLLVDASSHQGRPAGVLDVTTVFTDEELITITDGEMSVEEIRDRMSKAFTEQTDDVRWVQQTVEDTLAQTSQLRSEQVKLAVNLLKCQSKESPGCQPHAASLAREIKELIENDPTKLTEFCASATLELIQRMDEADLTAVLSRYDEELLKRVCAPDHKGQSSLWPLITEDFLRDVSKRQSERMLPTPNDTKCGAYVISSEDGHGIYYGESVDMAKRAGWSDRVHGAAGGTTSAAKARQHHMIWIHPNKETTPETQKAFSLLVEALTGILHFLVARGDFWPMALNTDVLGERAGSFSMDSWATHSMSRADLKLYRDPGTSEEVMAEVMARAIAKHTANSAYLPALPGPSRRTGAAKRMKNVNGDAFEYASQQGSGGVPKYTEFQAACLAALEGGYLRVRAEDEELKQICNDFQKTHAEVRNVMQHLLRSRPGLYEKFPDALIHNGKDRGPWTSEQDSKLKEHVDDYGPQKWAVCADGIEGRTSKQCSDRWHNQIDPAINKGPWIPAEDAILKEAYGKLGSQWALIAKQLPGRAASTVQRHARKLLNL